MPELAQNRINFIDHYNLSALPTELKLLIGKSQWVNFNRSMPAYGITPKSLGN